MSRLVKLLGTGGTIASRSGPRGRSASVTAVELLATLGELPDGLTVLPEDVTTQDSFALDLEDLLTVANRVHRALNDPVDGIVVTHGTDVMEETAFLLCLLHDDDRPVVLTGAQRPFDSPSPDGPANLRDALAVAASPLARGYGVLVVFDGLVYTARGVAKAETLSYRAFDSPGRGPVLRVIDGQVRRISGPWRLAPLRDSPEGLELPRVDVISAYPGADGVLLRASLDSGAAGVVIAALGTGNVGPELLTAVSEAIAADRPVLVCSRVPAGPVVPLYSGGGAELLRMGVHFGADLSPWQGRLLLSMACALPSPANAGSVVEAWLSQDGHINGLDQPQPLTVR